MSCFGCIIRKQKDHKENMGSRSGDAMCSNAMTEGNSHRSSHSIFMCSGCCKAVISSRSGDAMCSTAVMEGSSHNVLMCSGCCKAVISEDTKPDEPPAEANLSTKMRQIPGLGVHQTSTQGMDLAPDERMDSAPVEGTNLATVVVSLALVEGTDSAPVEGTNLATVVVPKLKKASSKDLSKTASAAFDFRNYTASKFAAVNAALDKAVPLQYPEKLNEAMCYSLLAEGKRVRPMLCIAACKLVGGTEEQAMPAACAAEMLHTMILIEDDLPCMDNDDMRRGVLTCHKKFGESTAVLAATKLFSHAFGHIARAGKGWEAEKLRRVITSLSKAADNLADGQLVDLISEGNPSVSLDTLHFIHFHKTAALLESSVVCGAILGGSTEEEVESLSEYGRLVGLLYQVVDDILDVTATSEELGKTAGKDVLMGKATYPRLLGMEETQQLADVLNRKAKFHLARFDQQNALPLLSLADYMLTRKK